MFRFDRLLTLSEDFSKAITELPEAKSDDSRTYFFTPKIFKAETIMQLKFGTNFQQKI